MTIITNTKPVPRIPKSDVFDFINNVVGVPITLAELGVTTDEVGQVVTIDTTTVPLTAPQVTQVEDKFFVTNVTPITTKGDILTHDNTNEIRKPVGNNNEVLTADDAALGGVSWKPTSGGSPVVTDADAILGILSDEVIGNSGDTIQWDENAIFGDVFKIVELPLGRFKLSGAVFTLSAEVSVTLTGGGAQSASINWQQSSTELGTYTTITNPNGRQGTFHTGNTSTTTKEKAAAIIDARAADVFVQAFLKPDGSSTAIVHNLSAEGSIDSFGTSAVANSPLTTLGDLLAHNGINDVRLPVGSDGQILKALASAPEGIVWGEGGFELIADETLAVAGSSFDVDIPVREFLFIIIYLEDSGGDLNAHFFFNDDGSGGLFAYRREENFGSISTFINEDFVQLDSGTPDINVNSTLLVFNQPGVDTAFMQSSVSQDGVSAGTLPLTQKAEGIWYDSDQVIKLNIASPGDVMSTNSRVIVYGSKT